MCADCDECVAAAAVLKATSATNKMYAFRDESFQLRVSPPERRLYKYEVQRLLTHHVLSLSLLLPYVLNTYHTLHRMAVN